MVILEGEQPLITWHVYRNSTCAAKLKKEEVAIEEWNRKPISSLCYVE